MEVQSIAAGPANQTTQPVQETHEPKAAAMTAKVNLETEPRDNGEGTPENGKRDDIPKIIEGMNAVLSGSGNHIRFVEHRESSRMMVEILDNKTEEVLRTIPDKQLLDLAAKIGEMLGVLLDHRT